ncbi:MAG: hypothetical protein H6933_08060 [Burkholderiaceae bacterium]|nr:hypothetical protein [Burkholderiaceae bacterium]
MTRFSKSTLAAAAAMALAACGGGGGGDGGNSSNTPPVAAAGADQMASRTSAVTLDGRGSSDADGNTLSYRWRQTAGTDVTGGSGVLEGATPSFTAPADVQTLEFELVVNDGTASSAGDRVMIHVLEDAAAALFVDAAAGSDSSGTGSMAAPYATVRHALAQVGSSQGDLYLRSGSGQTYDESGSTLAMPSGTSLYGGYGSGWVRDADARKAEVRTNSLGVRYSAVNHDTWVSGLMVRAAGSANAGDSVTGIRATGNGAARMTVAFNDVVAGDVGPGTADSPASSYGVYVTSMAFADVHDNSITAGAGGIGSAGTTGARGADGSNGSNGNRDSGRRAPGGSGGPGGNGGSGGERGGGINGNGGAGATGNDGSAPLGGSVPGGSAGSAGSGNTADGGGGGGFGNTGGPGMPGVAGGGAGTTNASFMAARGATGGTGGVGSGGGGGGGGEANNVGVVGGGGVVAAKAARAAPAAAAAGAAARRSVSGCTPWPSRR